MDFNSPDYFKERYDVLVGDVLFELRKPTKLNYMKSEYLRLKDQAKILDVQYSRLDDNSKSRQYSGMAKYIVKNLNKLENLIETCESGCDINILKASAAITYLQARFEGMELQIELEN